MRCSHHWWLSTALFLSVPVVARPVDDLARDVSRIESVRAIKDVQRLYAHYALRGMWQETGGLFASSARFIFDKKTIVGPARIADFLAERYGAGERGLALDTLHTMFVETPVINLARDGDHARGRWHVLIFVGNRDGSAAIEGGIFENEYVRVSRGWVIQAAHFYPQYSGSYERGWTNWGSGDLPLVSYHFTPRDAGLPIGAALGPALRTKASASSLAARVETLTDENAVRNVQAALGYYVDRRMWDDAVDLFTSTGRYAAAGTVTETGASGIRRALERMGPAGLAHGELNDRPQFDTIVRILPGGKAAKVTGIELAMLGTADTGKASWEITLFDNRFVKEGGQWKIAEVHTFPLLKADYATGWGRGRKALPAVALSPLPLSRASARGDSASAITSFAAIRNGVRKALAYDAVENISSAYGDYLDDFQSSEMGALFDPKGFKVSAFAGYYVGPERITRAARIVFGPPPVTRLGISYHWRIQPVIAIADDGRSANLRVRLFQPRTSKQESRAGDFYAAGFHGGMYHDQAVLGSDGVWRMWNLSLDEPYFFSSDWKGGWAAAKDPTADYKARPSPLLTKFPPDVPYAELGKREEHFRGGTGRTIEWPGILPMWFEYRNPVSGRVPEHYMPDCVPCTRAPELSLPRNGYQMPPTGPDLAR